MGIQDLIITPIYLILFLVVAYVIRPMVTNPATKPYFIPGLLVKFGGAIALGLIYQFYYEGGDTFTFHTHGSRWIWQAFMDNPAIGLELFFKESGDYNGPAFNYISKIWQFRDSSSWFLIKIAAFFDLFTFGTYGATGIFFAVFAFSGHWALFISFQRLYPNQRKYLAISTLFIPSAIFWGSGILKDSITLAALCWMTYSIIQLTLVKKHYLMNAFILIFMSWIIYSLKIYILLCFLVSASIFLYFQYLSIIKKTVVKFFAAPILISLFAGGALITINQITSSNSKYAIENIAQTAMITANDIRYGWGARNGDNSGYSLGELDGSISGLLKIAPDGIIVTLFRPWIWEIKNPLMLLASLESLAILLLTIFALVNIQLKGLAIKYKNPLLLFCLSFSLLFAFAVGVSTYNFGTLMRYKIPVMPFYTLFLVLAFNKFSKRV